MQVSLSRDSVAAGDERDAPHSRRLAYPDGVAVGNIIRDIVASDYLPDLPDDVASWSASSGVPLAVMARGAGAELLRAAQAGHLERFDVRDGVLHLHFSYHAQVPAAAVRKVLATLTLRAPPG
jgi:hypothetical protein